jgi:hypothetical protein
MDSLISVCEREVRIDGQLIRTARLEADRFEFLDDPQTMLEGLRKSATRIDLFTFVQLVPETSPKFAYPMEWDNFAVLPVTTFDQWWKRQAHHSVRTKVKKAEKLGIEVREVPFDDVLVKGIWEIYNECPVRQGRPFWHYGKDLETVRKITATFLDRSIFIGAFLEGRLIGFVKLLIDRSHFVASTMQVISMIQLRDKAPTNALIAQLVRSCADREIRHLTYGNFSYGRKQRDSLSDFKQYNGFQRIEVPRYYVPLTRTGRLALRLGLHHGIVNYLPEPMAAKLRHLRKAWYDRKLRSVAQAS